MKIKLSSGQEVELTKENQEALRLMGAAPNTSPDEGLKNAGQAFMGNAEFKNTGDLHDPATPAPRKSASTATKTADGVLGTGRLITTKDLEEQAQKYLSQFTVGSQVAINLTSNPDNGAVAKVIGPPDKDTAEIPLQFATGRMTRVAPQYLTLLSGGNNEQKIMQIKLANGRTIKLEQAANTGTSEGAIKGWETRKAGGSIKRGVTVGGYTNKDDSDSSGDPHASKNTTDGYYGEVRGIEGTHPTDDDQRTEDWHHERSKSADDHYNRTRKEVAAVLGVHERHARQLLDSSFGRHLADQEFHQGDKGKTPAQILSQHPGWKRDALNRIHAFKKQEKIDAANEGTSDGAQKGLETRVRNERTVTLANGSKVMVRAANEVLPRQVIVDLLAFADNLRVQHWMASTTNNDHRALGDLYGEFTDLVDELAELSFGKDGDRSFRDTDAIIIEPEYPAATLLDDGMAAVEAARAAFATGRDDDALNVLADMSAAINRTRYLLNIQITQPAAANEGTSEGAIKGWETRTGQAAGHADEAEQHAREGNGRLAGRSAERASKAAIRAHGEYVSDDTDSNGMTGKGKLAAEAHDHAARANEAAMRANPDGKIHYDKAAQFHKNQAHFIRNFHHASHGKVSFNS